MPVRALSPGGKKVEGRPEVRKMKELRQKQQREEKIGSPKMVREHNPA